MSNKNLSFKQFLEGLDFDFDTMDSDEAGSDEHENIDVVDDKELSKLKNGKGQKINKGISSDRSQIKDASASAKKANAAGM